MAIRCVLLSGLGLVMVFVMAVAHVAVERHPLFPGEQEISPVVADDRPAARHEPVAPRLQPMVRPDAPRTPFETRRFDVRTEPRVFPALGPAAEPPPHQLLTHTPER